MTTTVIEAGPNRINLRVTPVEEGLFGTSERLPNSEDWVICISPGLIRGTHGSTVLHELLHVIDFDYGLDLGERGVCALERALTTIIRRNPMYVRELLEDVIGG